MTYLTNLILFLKAVSLGLSFWVTYYLGRSNGKSTAGPFSTMGKISALNRNTLVSDLSRFV